MSYMVMECHPGYAVVLDDDGRFSKVANMHYEVGQTVAEVIMMRETQKTDSISRIKSGWVYGITAAAACLLLAFISVFTVIQIPYASVYMSINPEVRIDVNRSDVVVGLYGVNYDGELLIDGYLYKKKELDLVMDELIDRAIAMGYLSAGGQITLTLDADDDEWMLATEAELSKHLDEYLNDDLLITIDIDGLFSDGQSITIPVDDDSDYGSSDYSSDYGSSGYDD